MRETDTKLAEYIGIGSITTYETFSIFTVQFHLT